jgi:hypothetical protein
MLMVRLNWSAIICLGTFYDVMVQTFLAVESSQFYINSRTIMIVGCTSSHHKTRVRDPVV